MDRRKRKNHEKPSYSMRLSKVKTCFANLEITIWMLINLSSTICCAHKPGTTIVLLKILVLGTALKVAVLSPKFELPSELPQVPTLIFILDAGSCTVHLGDYDLVGRCLFQHLHAPPVFVTLADMLPCKVLHWVWPHHTELKDFTLRMLLAATNSAADGKLLAVRPRLQCHHVRLKSLQV